MTMLQRAIAAYNAAVQRMNDLVDQVNDAPEDADIDALQVQSDEAVAEVERTRAAVEQAERIQRAQQANPPRVVDTPKADPAQRGSIHVGEEEATYRPDTSHSFFRDLVVVRDGDQGAAERLRRHRAEVSGVEHRDVTTSDPGAAGIIPPIYLASALAELPRPGRPFADVLPTLPLPDVGETISIPKVQSGVTVAAQASQNSAISETDIDTQTVSVPVRTIAGMQDVSIQSLERSFPGLDTIVFGDLRMAYDAYLDTQCLAGAGSSGTHLGIRAVSSINTVTYTDASPTAAETIPKIYDAIQKIATNRYTRASHIVMHPRRAAWLASNLSTSFPLFQQGGFNRGIGSQDMGAVMNIAGLPVVEDPNIGTTYGGSSNEDEIYVVSVSDLYLMEGALRSDVFPSPGSGTLTVRLRLFAYSAFASARQPKSITSISGTGLATPTF